MSRAARPARLRQHRPRRPGPGPLRLSAFAVAGTALLAGCGGGTVVEEAEEGGPVARQAILGEPVTLQAEVGEILGPNSFTLGSGDTLVISPDTSTALYRQEVQVTGTVIVLAVDVLEAEYGIELEADEDLLLAGLEGELAVVADEVEVVVAEVPPLED